MRGTGVAVVLLVAGLIGIACDKGDAAAPPAPSASAGLGHTVPIKYSTALPSRGARPAIDKAIRGGSGSTLPVPDSRRLSEVSTDRQMRKAAIVDKVDCKNPAMDNAAECDGDQMFFCDDLALWVVNCNDEAKFGGQSGGSCFEAEKFIDCLGCGKADDGTDTCCDFRMTTCCGADGTCYSAK